MGIKDRDWIPGVFENHIISLEVETRPLRCDVVCSPRININGGNFGCLNLTLVDIKFSGNEEPGDCIYDVILTYGEPGNLGGTREL